MRLLWLKTGLLHPLDTGGKIRTYQMLRELTRSHHVTYLTLDDGSAPASARGQAQEYCAELVPVAHPPMERFSARFYSELARNVLSPLPYALARYRSPAMAGEISARAGDGVLVCDFLNPAVNVPAGLGCPSVLFEHNVEATILRRHAEVQRNPLKKAYLWDQWRKMRRYERAACARFDVTVAVSATDRDVLRRAYGLAVGRPRDAGVDTGVFRPTGAAPAFPHRIVFHGLVDWVPNEEGVRWFAGEVMPRVRARIPDARSPSSDATRARPWCGWPPAIPPSR